MTSIASIRKSLAKKSISLGSAEAAVGYTDVGVVDVAVDDVGDRITGVQVLANAIGGRSQLE
jgi:hypothetical protein